ncbi:MAG: helix-turn-helix transcriptional regulator [Paludibacter sp.]|nr:helix-turn-helix transcriptional regulator [Paludibacter sp.]
MKFKEKYNINSDFEDLFTFKSKEEELEHEAKMIMFRFLSELEKLNGKPIKKKDLAKAIETSPSFITQLYRGDKLINLSTLAKIQEAYGITFEITAKQNNQNYIDQIETVAKCIPFKRHNKLENSLYNKNVTPNYNYVLFINNTASVNKIAQ